MMYQLKSTCKLGCGNHSPISMHEWSYNITRAEPCMRLMRRKRLLCFIYLLLVATRQSEKWAQNASRKQETHSLAFWNCSSSPIIYNVSRESIRVAPRPPKLLTPLFVWGWSISEASIFSRKGSKSENNRKEPNFLKSDQQPLSRYLSRVPRNRRENLCTWSSSCPQAYFSYELHACIIASFTFSLLSLSTGSSATCFLDLGIRKLPGTSLESSNWIQKIWIRQHIHNKYNRTGHPQFDKFCLKHIKSYSLVPSFYHFPKILY